MEEDTQVLLLSSFKITMLLYLALLILLVVISSPPPLHRCILQVLLLVQLLQAAVLLPPLPAVVRQQEEERKAQEDFDSLFDDHHVFGIPDNIGNSRSDSYNETSTTTASSHDGGQNLLGDLFSLRRSRRTTTVKVLVKSAPIILQPTRNKVAMFMMM